MSLLTVKNLNVTFPGSQSPAVSDVSFELDKGQTLALVGESGSGKSVTALSILQLLPSTTVRGSACFEEQELLTASPKNLNQVRGAGIGMIFQEPMTSLNPLHKVEKQIGESLILHQGLSQSQARKKTLELLDMVGIDQPKSRLNSYPHELSGGQRQRVMIAMALANRPKLLIADEPTTALDVTIQAQIINLLNDLQQQLDMAMLLITHDLGVVRQMSDKACVMRQGQIVETGSLSELFENPKQVYTRQLIEAEPSGSPAPLTPASRQILQAKNIKVWFPLKKGILSRTYNYFRAVDEISLQLNAGESLGVVGESGSGKSTLGLALLKLINSTGNIVFQGQNLTAMSPKEVRKLRSKMQIVFQDPFGALSPRMTVAGILEEGLKVHFPEQKKYFDQKIDQILQEVELDPALRYRYPHEFSGGQRQRIAIARALVLRPDLVILDEPTSALDRAVQFQMIELLRKLQNSHNLSYIFISHDLKVVRALCHRVLVMQAGKVVESGQTEKIFSNPKQEYTKELLSSALAL